MGLTERLQVIATHKEPSNKHVIWLKDNTFRKWDGDGWVDIGGGNGTTDYKALKNKPLINGRVLEGNINLEIKGEKGDTGPKGEQGIQGIQGLNGKNGIGIAKVEQIVYSNEDSGENIVRVTLEDGTFTDITILNGSKGTSDDVDLEMSDISNNAVANSIIKKYVDYADNTLSERIANLEQNGGGVSNAEPQIINIELSEEYVTAIKKGYLNHDGVIRNAVPIIQMETPLEAGRYTHVVANGTEVLAKGYTAETKVGNTYATAMVHVTEFLGERPDTTVLPLVLGSGSITAIQFLTPYKSNVRISGADVEQQDKDLLKSLFTIIPNSEGVTPVSVTRITEIQNGKNYAQVNLFYSNLSSDSSVVRIESRDGSLMIEFDETGTIQRVDNFNMMPKAVYDAMNDNGDYYTKNEVNDLVNEAVDYVLGQSGSNVTIEVDAELSESSTNAVANKAVTEAIIEDEEVTAVALNELNERVSNAATKEELVAALVDVDGKFQNAKDVIDTSIIDNEEVIAAALNDLNKKVNDVYTKDEINTNFIDVNNTLKSYVDSSIATAITNVLNTEI